MNLSRSRIIVAVATLLWVAHVAVCVSLGAKSPGPFLSDLIQLVLGVLVRWLLKLAVTSGSKSE